MMELDVLFFAIVDGRVLLLEEWYDAAVLTLVAADCVRMFGLPVVIVNSCRSLPSVDADI